VHPMFVYILDSSAALRYIDDEAGADLVERCLRAGIAGRAALWIPAIQWGEIAGQLLLRVNPAEQKDIMNNLLPSELEVIPATADRAVRAASLKVDRKIPYADAFAVELALDSPDHILVTADYDFKAVEDLIKIEFLPQK
jgi:predicted nucleic acid-binding protein